MPVPPPRPAAAAAAGGLALAVLAGGLAAAGTAGRDAPRAHAVATTGSSRHASPASPGPSARSARSSASVSSSAVTGGRGGPAAGPGPDAGQDAPATAVTASASAVAPLTRRLRPDVFVSTDQPMSRALQQRLARLAPGRPALAVRTGRVLVGAVPVSVVAADPSLLRAYAPAGTAEVDRVWQSMARGEAVVAHAVARRLRLPLGGEADLRRTGGAPVAPLRIGAFATTTVPAAEVMVDDRIGDALGLRPTTGLLLTAGSGDVNALAAAARRLAGARGRVDQLTVPPSDPVAFLTGGSAARRFGAFSYRWFPDGTIAPDDDWVAANIVTATVPILGRVRCHRLMVPQLRGALAEVQARGLAGSIVRGQYGGCFVPRFIERNPNRPVSLHTWGIAIDLNVPGNLRGTAGALDLRVVAVFKRWGFAWGGDWRYTDPMHFELATLLDTG